MSKLNLWLIRHGETEVNTGIWSTKPAESCLTPLGKKQARYIATKIMQQPDLLIVSPLQRAKQTAQYLLKRWPNTELNIWPIYEHIYLSPVRLSYLDPLSRRKEIELYWSRLDPNYCDGKDAESFASFLKGWLIFIIRSGNYRDLLW
ncbi:phosphoglycerate mutase family protein [Legionella jordanis]|uniref:phosphoglycerate mutase family protein n=1 Tax=Legionella jordanis TaxID=456 RepID=UPI00217F7EE1|nr:phosphoglycerate mutase family protein [Legionella jordanis]